MHVAMVIVAVMIMRMARVPFSAMLVTMPGMWRVSVSMVCMRAVPCTLLMGMRCRLPVCEVVSHRLVPG